MKVRDILHISYPIATESVEELGHARPGTIERIGNQYRGYNAFGIVKTFNTEAEAIVYARSVTKPDE